jgi:hypothetical protein
VKRATHGPAASRRRRPGVTAALTGALLALALSAVAAPLVAVAGAAPTGTLTTVPAGATRKPAIVLDTSGIAGAVQMQFAGPDAVWTGWLPLAPQFAFTLPEPDGLKTINAQFTDGVDPTVYSTSVQIFLDRKRPTTVGFSSDVRRGQLATLYYKIKDSRPSCRQADVRLAVYRFGKRRTTFKLGVVATNAKLSKQFTCRWDKGWYTYEVLATDIAGNKSVSPPGVGVLFVK